MPAALYRVVEKTFSPQRRNFVIVGGVWREKIELAHRDAVSLAPISLAHRMFIFKAGKGGGPFGHQVEEIDLEPLREREERVHFALLTARHPDRVPRERKRLADQAAMLQSLRARV